MLPVPPFVELTVPLVLFINPEVVAIKSTDTVHVPLGKIVPPLKVNEVLPAAGAKTGLPQLPVLAFGMSATSRPAGKESLKATPLSVVLVLGFVIVKVSVLISPTKMGSGAKLFDIEGARTALTVTASEPVLFPSLLSVILEFGSTTADELTRLPTEVGVTDTVTVKAPVEAPRVTLAPLAVQVNKLLPLIEQLIFAELVMAVNDPEPGEP